MMQGERKKGIYGCIIVVVTFFILFGLGFLGEKLSQKKFSQTMGEIKEEKQATVKKAYLTFDDGPSDNTEKILDILKEKNVKATFFVVGREGENAKKIYRRILAEGNTLGLHSYSHDYEKIYSSIEGYKNDLNKLRKYLKEVTGRDITYYRFPGGSSNSIAKIDLGECAKYLQEEGIVYYDWNALNDDAVCFKNGPKILNEKIMKDVKGRNTVIILMHDLHECTATVDALPSLIDELKADGYEILPITKETKPIQHRKL